MRQLKEWANSAMDNAINLLNRNNESAAVANITKIGKWIEENVTDGKFDLQAAIYSIISRAYEGKDTSYSWDNFDLAARHSDKAAISKIKGYLGALEKKLRKEEDEFNLEENIKGRRRVMCNTITVDGLNSVDAATLSEILRLAGQAEGISSVGRSMDADLGLGSTNALMPRDDAKGTNMFSGTVVADDMDDMDDMDYADDDLMEDGWDDDEFMLDEAASSSYAVDEVISALDSEVLDDSSTFGDDEFMFVDEVIQRLTDSGIRYVTWQDLMDVINDHSFPDFVANGSEVLYRVLEHAGMGDIIDPEDLGYLEESVSVTEWDDNDDELADLADELDESVFDDDLEDDEEIDITAGSSTRRDVDFEKHREKFKKIDEDHDDDITRFIDAYEYFENVGDLVASSDSLQAIFDEIAHDYRLDPDDDAEEIYARMYDNLIVHEDIDFANRAEYKNAPVVTSDNHSAGSTDDERIVHARSGSNPMKNPENLNESSFRQLRREFDAFIKSSK
jgi:hypothetical protein